MNDDLITMEQFHCFISKYLPAQKMILSIDRTNWKRGKTSYNILVMAASIYRIAMPITFSIIDHCGASSTDQQIEFYQTIWRGKNCCYCI